MVRDLILDMDERNLLTEDKSNSVIPIFDSVWGDLFDEDKEMGLLICNIIIPEAYWELIKYDEGELAIRFKSPYVPNTNHFRIRLVALHENGYSLFKDIRGDFGLPAHSYVLSKNIASPVSACMLPFIDIDGEYLARFILSSNSAVLDKAYVYSSKATDININFCDNQASQLLSLCAPGNHYRYPTSGVGITHYLNRVISHSDLQKVLDAQFNADGKPVQAVEFDNETGKLDLLCSPEEEKSDTGLTPKDSLDFDFFSQFTDEFVRRNIVLDEVDNTSFIKTLNEYPRILNILMFIDSTTTSKRLGDEYKTGQFDGEGNIIPSDKYCIVSATLEADTIIMFDDKTENDIKGAPVFIVNDIDMSRLYTSLVEQDYWVDEICRKCFILKRRSVVQYMILQEQFKKGKGLFIIPQTSANMKNMVGLVQDEHTGRLIGVVSNDTNISDMVLDEITQRIYATQLFPRYEY